MGKKRGWEWVRGDLEDEDGKGLEERGGEEGGLGGGEKVGEVLKDGYLVDQLVDVRDV
jgi:hypothetical protein